MSLRSSDLRGLARLGIDAVLCLTGIVEQMHARIVARVVPWGEAQAQHTRGLTGFVYRTVKGTTRWVGAGMEAGLSLFDGVGSDRPSAPGREAVLAAVNGVWGDHLVAGGNPLAIRMTLRMNGEPLAIERASLAARLPHATGRIVVLVHGLCMNDLQWLRNGHDHGACLQRDAGFTPAYLHYNSGVHVADNGRRFDALLEQLVAQWPVPLQELVIVGHSMGGLVARSAAHVANQRSAEWLKQLRCIVCLGTPHHGAPLERGGHLVSMALGMSPYAAPLARVGQQRSAGITDLRFGNVHQNDARGDERHHQHRDDRTPVPTPPGVGMYVVAVTRERRASDGLVPLSSALGDHARTELSLRVPASHRRVLRGANHFDLLDRPEVYTQLLRWLQAKR